MVKGAIKVTKNDYHLLINVTVSHKQNYDHSTLAVQGWGGGGDAPPMSFSGMAAEPLGGSR